MSELHGIKRSNHRESESSFERLREEGVRLAQAASGDRWTDYNLHDPGVTMLEQLCYGLTDIAYRIDFPVADHLSGPGDTIAFDQLALHPPEVIFPCGATTALDYRRVLLDEVEGLDDARLVMPDRCDQEAHGGSAADTAFAGVYRLMLRVAPPLPPGVDSRTVDARAAYRAHRNLCEDIDPHITTVREVNCELRGDIELSGPRDAVDVLADIYDRCARVIAQTPVYRSAGELVREGQTVEESFTGPRTPNGIVDDAGGSPRLFVSALALVIESVEGVGSVHRLTLKSEEAPQGTDSLPLRGVDWALRLHVPRNASEARAGVIQLTRRGKPLVIPAQEVYDKYEKLQARARAQRTRVDRGAVAAGAADVGASEADPGYELPRGTHRDLQRYRSVQEHFPPIYHLGRHSLPEHAPLGEQAQVKQLKAYLLLFEQMIANAAARVHHLRELFTVDAAARNLWWQGLGDDSVPGVEALYRGQQSPEAVAATAFGPFDRYVESKNRALDHLLGLHGETYAQNSLRQFYGHATPDELDALLLQNKVAYLRDIVELNRDRAGAFNYARPAWNAEVNCSGLQKKVCLLLGFPPGRIRPLTEALRRQKRRIATRRPRGAQESVTSDHVRRSVPAGSRTRVHSHAEMERHLGRVHWLRGAEIPAAFFRVGAYADRYHVQPIGGASRLLLGPDEDDHWWSLGDEFATDEDALRVADSVRWFLRRLNELSEGLHIVEHVLLRPFGTGVGHSHLGVPSDFYAFRLTAVLPAWTVRTHQESFRAFAEETIAINCPAHILPRVVWLDYADMAAFEYLYEAWLAAKLGWANERDVAAESYGAASERLDYASCRLIEVLLAQDSDAGEVSEPQPDGAS